MLAGYAPFYSEQMQEIYFKVINWSKYFQVPDDIKLSKEGLDFMNKMISDPNNRLGKNGSEEIKSHPFFKGIDWDNIRNTMKPPFIPDIENDYDTKYFETCEEEKDEPFYPPKKGLKKRKDAEWLGYTYKGGNDEDNDKFQQNVEKKVEESHLKEENVKNIDNNKEENNIKNK